MSSAEKKEPQETIVNKMSAAGESYGAV